MKDDKNKPAAQASKLDLIDVYDDCSVLIPRYQLNALSAEDIDDLKRVQLTAFKVEPNDVRFALMKLWDERREAKCVAAERMKVQAIRFAAQLGVDLDIAAEDPASHDIAHNLLQEIRQIATDLDVFYRASVGGVRNKAWLEALRQGVWRFNDRCSELRQAIDNLQQIEEEKTKHVTRLIANTTLKLHMDESDVSAAEHVQHPTPYTKKPVAASTSRNHSLTKTLKFDLFDKEDNSCGDIAVSFSITAEQYLLILERKETETVLLYTPLLINLNDNPLGYDSKPDRWAICAYSDDANRCHLYLRSDQGSFRATAVLELSESELKLLFGVGNYDEHGVLQSITPAKDFELPHQVQVMFVGRREGGDVAATTTEDSTAPVAVTKLVEIKDNVAWESQGHATIALSQQNYQEMIAGKLTGKCSRVRKIVFGEDFFSNRPKQDFFSEWLSEVKIERVEADTGKTICTLRLRQNGVFVMHANFRLDADEVAQLTGEAPPAAKTPEVKASVVPPGKAAKVRELPIFLAADLKEATEIAAGMDGESRKRIQAHLKSAGAHDGLRKIPNFKGVAQQLSDEVRPRFENFAEVLDYLGDELTLIGASRPEALRFAPILLDGDPGIGKTAFAQEIARLTGLPFRKLAAGGGQGGFQLSGTASHWGNSHPGMVFNMLARSEWGSGVLLIDEVDKISGSTQHPMLPALLDLLEPETARCYTDESLGLRFDASRLIVFMTSNRIDKIDEALLSRARHFHIDKPDAAQKRLVALEAHQQLNAAMTGRRRIALDEEALEELIRQDVDIRVLLNAVRSSFAHALRDKLGVSSPVVQAVARKRMGF